MNREERSHIRITDAQINELVQGLQQRLETHQSVADAPELRMAHDIRSAYRAEASEDARSLERVLMRLQEDQAETQSKVLFPRVYQQKERIFTMQNTLEATKNIKKSRKWQLLTGVLAAALLLTLIIGGLLLGLRAGQAMPMAHSTSSASSSAPDALFASFGLASSANQTNKGYFDLAMYCKNPQKDWSGSLVSANTVVSANTLKWLRTNPGICPISLAIYKAIKTRSGVGVVKAYNGDLLVINATRDYRTGKDTYSSVPTSAHFTTVEFYMNGRFLGTVHFPLYGTD